MTRRPTRRPAALLALAFACGALLAVAAPVRAAVTLVDFDDVPATDDAQTVYGPRGVLFGTGCSGLAPSILTPAPSLGFTARSPTQTLVLRPSGAGSEFPCGGATTMLFQAPQRTIRVWVRPTVAGTITLAAPAGSDGATRIRANAPADRWTWITLIRDAGSETRTAELYYEDSRYAAVYVDDLAASDRAPSPGTVVDATPADPTPGSTATIRFHGAEPGSTFTCTLDDGRPSVCTDPLTYSGLGDGPHAVTIRATDVFDANDPAPPTVRWTTVPAPVPTATPTPTPPVVLTQPIDPCTVGPDADGDGIADACDSVGRPATVAPVAGESGVVRVTSGEVFIRLPGTAARAATATRARDDGAGPQAGFVPLKGAANVPVGSTVDARAGTIELTTATGASATGSGGASARASARVSAAIFQIRQRRAARKAKPHRKPPPSPTDLLLRTPDATIAALACTRGSRAVVRGVSATVPKGLFRVVGIAATVTTTTKTATVRTEDRCDGTYTEVGSGTAHVYDAVRRRTVTVRAGRAYHVRGSFLTLSRAKGR